MDYIYLIGGLIVLIVGGEFLVKGATALAQRFRLSPLVIGLTIVSFGTSAPELLVSIMATLDGHSDVAIGNVVGSNISNIGLVLGATVIVRAIHVKPQSILIDWPVMFLVSVLFYAFCLSSFELSMLEGLVFTTGLIAYNFGMIKYAKTQKKEDALDEDNTSTSTLGIDLLCLIIGVLALSGGAHFLVEGVVSLAKEWGVSERVISLSLVAFGTSLPELTTSIMAAVKKETELALGNVLGSNIYNILCILGISSLITPIKVNPEVVNWDVFWMLGVALFIYPFMRYARKIGLVAGIILLLTYFVYIYLIL